MEWVEVRGETVAEAEELALDQLGVGRDDAEFEIVQSAESRWLGLKRVEARVRARVRPSAPPPKVERNRRSRGKGRDDGGGSGSRGGDSRQSKKQSNDGRQGARSKSQGRGGGSDGQRDQNSDRGRGGGQRGQQSRGGESSQSGRGDRNSRPAKSDANRSDKNSANKNRVNKEQAVNSEEREEVPVKEQQDVVTEFLSGIVSGFGLDATVLATMDEDTIVGSIDGAEVGLLIGPRAGTLKAVQELARTTVQRHADGRDTSRLVIDVAGYRERRKAALVGFTEEQSKRVLETGEPVALEPMDAPDRKSVHDAAAEIDGITSSSAGEDPKRHVVLSPS
jgi:spoIIIJ-associated protein